MDITHQLARTIRLVLVAFVAASAFALHAVANPAPANAMRRAVEGTQTIKACTDGRQHRRGGGVPSRRPPLHVCSGGATSDRYTFVGGGVVTTVTRYRPLSGGSTLLAATDIHRNAFQALVFDPGSGKVVEERFSAESGSLGIADRGSVLSLTPSCKS